MFANHFNRITQLHYLDVLHGRLLGSHVNFHWQLGGHEGRQDSAVLIFVVTQRGVLVVGTAYGCPYYKGSSDFSLVSKVPQRKNRLFPTKHLPLCKPIRFAS